MSSPSCCCNAPPHPRLIFYLHNGHRCPGSYYLTRVRLSKAVNITSYYSFSCSFLIKPLPCTVSPEATEVESHHVLLWSTTFCFSRVFPLPRLEGLNHQPSHSNHSRTRHNYAPWCTTLLNALFCTKVLGVAATATVLTPRCPDSLICADMTQHMIDGGACSPSFSWWDWSHALSPISARAAAPFHHHLWVGEIVWRFMCWSVWKGFWVKGMNHCCVASAHRETQRGWWIPGNVPAHKLNQRPILLQPFPLPREEEVIYQLEVEVVPMTCLTSISCSLLTHPSPTPGRQVSKEQHCWWPTSTWTN